MQNEEDFSVMYRQLIEKNFTPERERLEAALQTIMTNLFFCESPEIGSDPEADSESHDLINSQSQSEEQECEK